VDVELQEYIVRFGYGILNCEDLI